VIEIIFWCILIFIILLATLFILTRMRSDELKEFKGESVDYRAIKRSERDRQLREWQREYYTLLGIDTGNYLERLLYRGGDDSLISNTLMLKRQMKTRRDYENERLWNEP